MDIRFSKRGTTLVIDFVGEIDHHAADYIRQKIDTELLKSTTRNTIFDFTNVTFMDSSGIGVIMGRYKNIKSLGGKAAIINAGPLVKRIFDMAGLLKIIPEYDSVDKALEAMLD